MRFEPFLYDLHDDPLRDVAKRLNETTEENVARNMEAVCCVTSRVVRAPLYNGTTFGSWIVRVTSRESVPHGLKHTRGTP